MSDPVLISRLSDEKIEDVIIRSYLYRDILKAIETSAVATTSYELKHDEKYRPDLIAFRVYGTTAARWLVKLLCDNEDEERALPVGTTIRFPDIGYVRERIRHFENGGGI